MKVHGSIFAMLTSGNLVVKLPRDRVAELIAVGTRQPFLGGNGRPMREWVTVTDDGDDHLLTLAREACDFVASLADEAERARQGDAADRNLSFADDDIEFSMPPGADGLRSPGVWQRHLGSLAAGKLSFTCARCGDSLLLNLEV